MSRLENLTSEQKLIVLASRLTFSDEDKRELQQVIKEDLNWLYIYHMAIKNKVLSLLYFNLCKLKYKSKIDCKLHQLSEFYQKGHERRNKKYFEEFMKVSKALYQAQIPFAPLKGAFLIPEMYKDFGIRTINDIDCFVSHSNVKRLTQVMNSLGYRQMDYDENTGEFKEITREVDLLWKMNMNNLFPFSKLVDDDFCNIVEFDFSFSLDFRKEVNIVDSMIDHAEKINGRFCSYLRPEDFFIHLCCHLFKEATNVEWVELGQDLNIIKFCDIREYLLRFMDNASLNKAIEFAKKNDFEEAIYYTIYYLKEIYNDGYEQELLDYINIEDSSFIHHFGEREYGKKLTWNKSFWQRMFSEDNRDELKEDPKFKSFEQEKFK